MTNPKDSVGAKKAPLGVVPVALVIGVAPAMAVGAKKYGPFNWRGQPVQVMTYIEAIQRHLYAFVDGQDVAEDTGVSHLAHAGAGLAILMDAYALNRVIDNRPEKGPAADMLREQDKSEPVVPTDSILLERDNPLLAMALGTEPVRRSLCICPPVRASYGDHLLTCPRYEVDLDEPYRDVGGQG
jgi:hypothetical protein